MIIKKYTCKRFAGIQDKDIEFQDGLNVILGSNEAGKSTVVEAIHSLLFKSSKVGKRATEDINFRNKFMPVTSGDSIDGELILNNMDGEYRIKKEWGVEPLSQLVTPDSDIIRNEDTIKEKLKEILIFGESTYSSVFFSKQANLKGAIQDIISNKEATSEISSLMRRAIMELDGISLEKLQRKIDESLEELYNRWDVDKNYPENNRGINNPYKVGVGKILESFYKKENLRLDIDRANESEKYYNDMCNKLKSVEIRIGQLKEKKDQMEALESDVTQRLVLKPQILKLNSDMDTFKNITIEWPKNQQRLEQVDDSLNSLSVDFKKLNDEKDKVKVQAEKNLLIKKMEKVNELKDKVHKAQDEIQSMKDVSKDHIRDLEDNQENLLKAEAMLHAGVIIGQFNYFKGKDKLMVTKGFDEPVELGECEIFCGDGYVKLEAEGIFELEIKSGDMDFNDLRSKFNEYKKNLEKIFEELEVKDIEEAKLNREKLQGLKRELDSLNSQLYDLLGELNVEEIKERIESLGDLGDVRDLGLIEGEIEKLNKKHLELMTDKKVIENNIYKWTEAYGDLDGLFEKTISTKMEQREVQEKLDKLKPLPEEYESPEEFRKDLAFTREEYDGLQNSLSDLKRLHFEAENNLSETSLEELTEELKSEEILFNKRLEEGRRLLKIREVYVDTKASMDKSFFSPVVQTFSRYLSLLTNASYKESNIDNEFKLRLEKDNNNLIPLNLLSSGTYDSVALALRLSILEYILGERKGFLILDDCLVDLDPYRKSIAAKLIGEFSSKHQVIFTTCSPDTAQLLGGNIIEM